MRNSAVLSRTFPARISAVEALLDAMQPRADNAERLRAVANELDGAGPLYGYAATAVTYAAFAELLRTIAMLVRWRAAVFSAEVDAQRFLTAAQLRHRQWQAEYGADANAAVLVAPSTPLAQLSSIEEIPALCRAIASTPLPVGVFSDERTRIPKEPTAQAREEKPEPPELAVAFLSFLVDSTPAEQIHFMQPGVVYDLELEVRVSRWPESAQHLLVTPVTIEPRSSYEFPDFQWSRPTGDAPYRLRQRGRAVLNAAQGLTARPFEFRYAAAFKPETAEQPVAVVGQRTLLVEGIDLTQSPLTGYLPVDQKLMELRNMLRRMPGITAADLDNTLKVLVVLAGLAARAVQDRLFRDAASEAQFQSQARDELRRAPYVAADLEEHPHVAGGITDLSFRGIPIELKYEDQTALSLKQCERFAGQAASYAIGRGKRVAILCVLDNTPKRSAPYPAEGGIEVLAVPTPKGEVEVITILIQGNLPRPSDLSR
jgi:hypothetical protein